MGHGHCSREGHIHLDVVARTTKSIKGYISKGLEPRMRDVMVSFIIL